ncbi:MAG: Undecaprenyl phosphate-alpha-4-amino-4-deoxy-L-arabinose arabinosyl transferase [Phycisphaerae bacterium]|nr:Undecaprenyl phosphate-alpha-4-amino-4-deoxy-L-arabinose arabinosyl transferase [Phycisphaerae bacterium]
MEGILTLVQRSANECARLAKESRDAATGRRLRRPRSPGAALMRQSANRSLQVGVRSDNFGGRSYRTLAAGKSSARRGTAGRRLRRGSCLCSGLAVRHVADLILQREAESLRREPGGARPTLRRTAADVAVIALLVAIVTGISATAPASTYAHAQRYQIDCVLDAIHNGRWLLPRSQSRGLDRKPPLYIWLDAPIVMLTGVCDDIVFRVPTMAATLLTGLMIYSLGRRWHDRRVGLLAAALFLTAAHMGKLAFMALTDMLLTCTITAAVLCADRVLYHRAGVRRRGLWIVGFWLAMIVGALAKGWGLVNGCLVGGTLLLASGLRNGLRTPRPRAGWRRRLGDCIRLLWRRWRRDAAAMRLPLGLAACLLLLTQLYVAMARVGGESFLRVVYVEFWQRLTGVGESPPGGTSVPPIVQLLYYDFPVSVFVIGAFFLVSPRLWLRGSGPILLPLCWIAAVMVPFSVSHGFRPDYMAPCYPAMALLGAWAVIRLADAPADRRRRLSPLRHAFAAPAVTLAVFWLLLPLNLLLKPYMSRDLYQVIRVPVEMPEATRWTIVALMPAGILLLLLIVRASLSWRIRQLAMLTVVAMLGMLFMDRHMLCRHASTLDGETMRQFARQIEPVVGAQPCCLAGMDHTTVPLYLGRWGERILPPADPAVQLNESSARWIVVSQRGLVEIGAARVDPKGRYRFKVGKTEYAYAPDPASLGRVHLTSPRPVKFAEIGEFYLIELKPRPIVLPGRPVDVKSLLRGESDEDLEGG